MHALVGVFNMDRAKTAEQRVELHERIVPLVSKLPGFISGHWSYDPATNKHYSHIVLETEEAAKNLASMVASQARQDHQNAHGVAIESLAVVEVMASAKR